MATKEKPAGVNWGWVSPLVDVNGDGHLDLIWYGHHGGGAAFWFGKGDGTFTFDGHQYESRWVFAGRDPVWSDVNGDGFVDGIGTEHAPGGWLHLNDGTAHWKKTALGRFGGLGAFMWTDADGDGRHVEAFVHRGFYTVDPDPRTWREKFPEKVTLTPAWRPEDVIGWPADEEKRVGYDAPRFHDAFAVDLDGDDRSEIVLTFLVGLGTDRVRSCQRTK
jgi:hypothetical protein